MVKYILSTDWEGMSIIPNPQLPRVHVLEILQRGAVHAISSDFSEALHLRAEIMMQLKRICEQRSNRGLCRVSEEDD